MSERRDSSITKSKAHHGIVPNSTHVSERKLNLSFFKILAFRNYYFSPEMPLKSFLTVGGGLRKTLVMKFQKNLILSTEHLTPLFSQSVFLPHIA